MLSWSEVILCIIVTLMAVIAAYAVGLLDGTEGDTYNTYY